MYESKQVAYNVHLDDFYHPERFALQRSYLLYADLVSSEFQEVVDGDVRDSSLFRLFFEPH